MAGPDALQRDSFGDSADVTDRRLAILARGGNSEAFDTLIERHHASIFRLCWAMLCDRSDAEDAVQETFVRTYQSLPRYDTERAFAPWLRGVAAKVCLQALRRRSRHVQRQSSLEDDFREPAAPEPPEVSQLATDAVAALAELNETYRLPLTLFYLHEASVAEVAEALGISPGAARVRLHRGREQLKEMLMTDYER